MSDTFDTGGDTGSDTERPRLSLKAAATACGVSRDVIRRRLSDIEGAVQDEAGRWSIPVDGLIAAGLTPYRATPAVDVVADTETDTEVDRLRRQLADAERRAAVAEARLDERDRALRFAESVVRVLPPAPGPRAPQRRFWRR